MLKNSTHKAKLDDADQKHLEEINKLRAEYDEILAQQAGKWQRTLETKETDHKSETGQARGFLEEARSTIKELRDNITSLLDKVEKYSSEKCGTDKDVRVLEERVRSLTEQIADRNMKLGKLREEQTLLQKTMELILRRLNGLGTGAI